MKPPEACIRCSRCKQLCIVEKLKPEVSSSVLERENPFLCASCWKCMDICPAGIDIYGMMMEARRKGRLPEDFKMSIENIINTGYSMPMRDINVIREMYGLEPIETVSPEIVKKLLRGVNAKR